MRTVLLQLGKWYAVRKYCKSTALDQWALSQLSQCKVRSAHRSNVVLLRIFSRLTQIFHIGLTLKKFQKSILKRMCNWEFVFAVQYQVVTWFNRRTVKSEMLSRCYHLVLQRRILSGTSSSVHPKQGRRTYSSGNKPWTSLMTWLDRNEWVESGLFDLPTAASEHSRSNNS